MNMGSPAGPFKNTGDEDFIIVKARSADRADTRAAAFEAVYAAPQMHKPVLPVERRKSRRFYQLPVVKYGGTNGTGLGRSGKGFAFWLPQTGTFSFFGKCDTGSAAKGEKQGIAEPEEGHSYNNQNQYFKI
jgi:hypothetical protein